MSKRKKDKQERYELREGFRLPVDGQTVGSEIERIKREHGGEASPPVVVEESRPEEAALHPCFEWDDERAAELYRIDQARYVVRSYYVVTGPEEAPERTIANVAVIPSGDRVEPDGEPATGRVYVSATKAMNDAELREQVLAEVEGMLRGVWNRYRHLPGLGDLFREAVARLEADRADAA